VSLTVQAAVTAPTITAQPTSETVNVGASATFGVTASGTAPLSYQWQKLVNGTWTNISGATSATFTISAAQASDAGQYQVVVSNSAGQAVSNTVSLTVNSVSNVLFSDNFNSGTPSPLWSFTPASGWSVVNGQLVQSGPTAGNWAFQTAAVTLPAGATSWQADMAAGSGAQSGMAVVSANGQDTLYFFTDGSGHLFYSRVVSGVYQGGTVLGNIDATVMHTYQIRADSGGTFSVLLDGTVQASGLAVGPAADWSAGIGQGQLFTQGGQAGLMLGTRFDNVIATGATVATTDSIWSSSAVPANVYNDPAGGAELGVKFQSDVAGSVTALRFYKAAGETGTDTGHLWDRNGNLLASVTFTNETASGWQQVTLSNPVAIQANTTYIVSYHENGVFAYTLNTFTGHGVDNPPLHALADGASGGNGVYHYDYQGGSAFPTQTYQGNNYFADVVFTPATVSGTLFADNFNSGTASPAWAFTSASAWSVVNGQLVQSGPTAGNWAFQSASVTLPAGALSWQADMAAGPGANSGLAAVSANGQDVLYFFTDGSGHLLYSRIVGGVYQGWTELGNINAAVMHTYQIREDAGGTFSVLLDGAVQASGITVGPAADWAGGIGQGQLFTQAGQAGLMLGTRFDNVVASR
jgi:hypothetical protein